MSTPAPPQWKSLTYSVNIPIWIFTGIATASVIARIISKGPLAKSRNYTFDDAIIVVSAIVLLSGAALLSAAISAGTRVSLQNPAGTLPQAFVLSFAGNLSYCIGIPLPKIAVAILLARVFAPSQLGRTLLITPCVLLFLFGVATYLMNWLQCTPIATQWDPWKYPNGKCWPGHISGDAAFAFGAFSAFQDFALATYPATQLKNLQMAFLKKVYLSAILGLGFIAGAFAIVKTYQLSRINDTQAEPAGVFNITLYTGLWSAIENSMVIIAACAPITMPLVHWVREESSRRWSTIATRLLGSQGKSSRSDSGVMTASQQAELGRGFPKAQSGTSVDSGTKSGISLRTLESLERGV